MFSLYSVLLCCTFVSTAVDICVGIGMSGENSRKYTQWCIYKCVDCSCSIEESRKPRLNNNLIINYVN